eukprot:5060255-Prymnesium_polylepis.1
MDEYKYGLRYRMYCFKLKPVLDELKDKRLWDYEYFCRPSTIRKISLRRMRRMGIGLFQSLKTGAAPPW